MSELNDVRGDICIKLTFIRSLIIAEAHAESSITRHIPEKLSSELFRVDHDENLTMLRAS